MILVAGVPRSGTSWVAKVLSFNKSIKLINEPDNEHNNLIAYIYKQKLPRFPYLRPDAQKNGLFYIYEGINKGKYLYDYSKTSLLIKKLANINFDSSEDTIVRKNVFLDNLNEHLFELPVKDKLHLNITKKLVEGALLFKNKNRYKKKEILIKTVHSILALPYIQKYFQPGILILVRHPASIVSSHLRLDNSDIWRNLFIQKNLMKDYLSGFETGISDLEHNLEKAGAQVGAFHYVLAKQIEHNPGWNIVRHEQLCLDPHAGFYDLYKTLNLEWSDGINEKISELNKDGSGYSVYRISRDQIDKWKYELSDIQVEQIKTGYNVFPPSFCKDFK